MHPQPVPVEDYIEHLWQSVQEGLITWQELNDLQATFLASQAADLDIPAIYRRGNAAQMIPFYAWLYAQAQAHNRPTLQRHAWLMLEAWREIQKEQLYRKG